jgi:sugar/nucleoside kinase (ribokinase family)
MNQAHTLDTALNVFADFSPKIPDAMRHKPYVMLGNIDPDLQLQVLEQMQQPKLTMVDTMNFWIESKPDSLINVIKKCDIVLLNDAEARQLCNTASLQKAARELLKMGVSRVIIKKGENGCVMFSHEDFFSAPAFPLEVVKDPTGAGDTFAGGFIGYLAGAVTLDEPTFRQAVIAGTTMASFTVEEFSLGRISTLQTEEISNRCNLLRRHTVFPELRLTERLVQQQS